MKRENNPSLLTCEAFLFLPSPHQALPATPPLYLFRACKSQRLGNSSLRGGLFCKTKICHHNEITVIVPPPLYFPSILGWPVLLIFPVFGKERKLCLNPSFMGEVTLERLVRQTERKRGNAETREDIN